MSRRGRSALLVLLVAAAYGASLANDFVFDDAIFVTRDERVRDIAQTHRLFVEPLWGFNDTPGNTHVHQYYRPLQTAPLAVSLALFGDTPIPAHLLNLLVHAANCTLVLWLFGRAGLAPNAAFLAAAIFAVHPAWSEATIWISDIAGLGAALSLLTILRLHAAARAAYAPAITVVFLAGLWCKEVAILAPVLMAADDILLTRARRQRPGYTAKALGYLALIPAFATYATLRVRALGGVLPGLMGEGTFSPPDLAANALALIPSYLRTFAWPFELNMYHDFTAAGSFADPRVIAGLIVAMAVAIGAGFTLRRRPAVAFALIWMAVTTAPYLLVRWPKLNVYAERYTYLPGIGAVLLVALTLNGLNRDRPNLRRATALVACFLLPVFVSVDAARSTDWRDEITVYTKTLGQSARAELIRNNLALRLLETGRHQEGIAQLEELLRIDPDFADAHHNMGLLRLATGEHYKALSAFERARELNPNKPATLLNLGYVYDLLGRREDAVSAYRRLVTTDPRHGPAWYNLAIVALESGQRRNARTAALQVLAINPTDRAAQTLLAQLDRATGAEENTATAQPSVAAAALRAKTREHCARARGLIEQGRLREAEDLLAATAWLDETAALPHHYLANLYYLTNRPVRALASIRKAMRLAPAVELYRRNAARLEKALAESNNRVTP